MPLLVSKSPVFDVTVAFFVIVVFQYLRSRQKNRTPLPPSPQGYPIVGHYFRLPEEQPWITYKKWGDECGSDVIFLNMMGQPTIVLNSSKSATELLERRSSINSDRHPMPMMELIGWRFNFAFQPDGTEWRNHRRMFRQLLMSSNYEEHEVNAACSFVLSSVERPKKWASAVRHMAADVIFTTASGIDIKPESDPFVELAERSMQSMAMAGNPGSYVVDYSPIVNKLPSWFPGTGCQKVVAEYAKYVYDLPRAPFELVKSKMEGGGLKLSIASNILEELRGDESEKAAEKEEIIKHVLGTMYAAGADTTVSSVSTFLLAMVQHPDMLQKGQTEIDEVVGSNRLPEFSDKDSFPYVQALVKESLRWNPVAPLGVSHATSTEDIYDGYKIPKGTALVPNIWAILREEALFGPDTHLFKPERFLNKDGSPNPNVPDPEMAFGFERRICAGKELATSSMWITIAFVLATLDVTTVKDNSGNPIEPSEKYTTGLLSYPEPFRCDIRFRSNKAEELVKAHLTQNGGRKTTV